MKGELKVFETGDILFNEGEPGGSLFFVKEGKVDVFREKDGVEVILSTLVQGDILGTVSVFDRSPRSASARAATRVMVLFVSGDAIESNLKIVPIWVTAILKDTVCRLRAVDEKLLDAKILERRILERVGTVFQHAAQLANLLAGFVRVGTVEEYGDVLFPLKGFLPRAESVILRDADYLQRIFDAFITGGLIKPREDKKYGPCLLSPKAGAIEDFAVFVLDVGRRGDRGFVPLKYSNYLSSIMRVQRAQPERESWPVAELQLLVTKDMGRASVNLKVFDAIEALGLISKKGKDGTEYVFSATSMGRRLVFEAVSRALQDVSEKVAA